ncbi:MAG: hypothetical protein R6W77_04505 [Trueperaceae bacterium]
MKGTKLAGLRLAAIAAFAQVFTAAAQDAPATRDPLVTCTATATGPCVQVATTVEDIVGVWKQYLGNPMLQAPGRMGFIRYRPDGSYSLAPTAADTAAPFGMYPRGTISFDGETATILVDGDAVPAECRTSAVQIHVLRYGMVPFGLFYVPIQDECAGRRADLAMPLLWVGE